MKATTLWTLAVLVGMAVPSSPQAEAAIAQREVQSFVDGGGRKVVVVRHRPPASRPEVRTRRPSGRHVWVDGHWTYHRGRFVWKRGRWVVRPSRTAVYVRSRWVRGGGGWVMVGGHWRL